MTTSPHPGSDEDRAQVERYLSLCQQRDAAGAQAYWSPDAKVVFPGPSGGLTFGSVEEMFASSNRRFRRAAKQPEFYVTGSRRSDDRPVVISTGTLQGETLTGESFSAVRYVDLFVMENGRIREQLVWNDLAEAGL